MTSTAQDIRATVTIVGQSQGLDGVSGELNAVAQAQSQVAATGAATATVTDLVSRRVLSQGAAFERMRASLDPTVKATQQLERGLALADKALRTGQTSAEAHAVVVGQLKARYDATVTSIDAATKSVQVLDRALAQPRRVQIRVDQITGVTRDPVSADRGADIAAYGEALDVLRAKIEPAFALQRQYKAQLDEINQAARVGAISEEARAAAIARAADSYAKATQALRQREAQAGMDPAAAQKARAQAIVGGQMIVPDRGADIAAYGGELDRLRAKYSPLFAAQREYKAQLDEIRDAARVGAISQGEMATAVQRTKDAFARQVTDLKAKAGGQLTANQAQNLFYQGTDIATSLAGGMSPMTVLMQQGGQIAPIFAGPGSASVKGALTQAGEAVTGFLGRIGLVGGALITGATAAVAAGVAWRAYAGSLREVDLALAGRGRASGATTGQIGEIAAANADAARVSVREARSMAAGFASTGQIGAEMYGGLIRIAKDYATVAGGDLAEAQKELASSFADPARGVDALTEKVGGFNDRITQNIKNLAAQGDRLGAQRVLLDGLSGSVSQSSDLISGWSKVWGTAADYVSNKWDALGRIIDKALMGGSLDERLENAETRLRNIQVNNASAGIFANPRLQATTQSEVDELRQQRDARDRRRTVAQAAQNNRDVMNLVRGLDPAQKELQDTTNAAVKLRTAISDPVRFGLDTGQIGQIQAQFERLQNLTRSMREDMERYGSVSAANAVRAAQNANGNIGLNNVDLAIAQKNQTLQATLRDKGWDNLESRDAVNRQYMERASAPNLDARDLSSLQAEREARLKVIAERDALVTVTQIEIDGVRKSAEEAAKRTSVSGDFISAMINVESRGRTDARNDRSSATGLGQFITETWDRLFKKTFPERASGMSDGEIAARRTNRDDSIALIKVYAEENQRALEKAGLDTSNRNQYLAWFAGATGAIKLLRADPGTDATSILGQQAARANPTIIPGKSAGQVIDWADRTINKNQVGIRNTEREAGILRSQVTLTEQTTEAEARRAKVQELLNDAIGRGTEVGRTFATAQELIGAKTEKLTDTQRNERQAILDSADAYAKQAAAIQNSALMRDLLFERSQIGRTTDEAAVASRLRGTGLGMDSAEASAVRLNQTLSQTKDLGKEAFGGFVSDITRGTSALDALKNSLTRILDKLISMSTDKIFSTLFDGLGKSSGGGGSGLFGNFFGSLFGGGGSGGGIDVGATSWMPKFATGGVMTDRGHVPLTRYAGGGIASTPQLAMYGEGRLPEAYVPLPDGRSIPVSVRMQREQGGAGGMAAPAAEAPIIVNTTGQPVRTEQVQGPRGPRDAIVIGKTLAGAIMNDPDVHAALARTWGLKRMGR